MNFSNKIDFTWFELWHHEGRRARHGASMMGPDYTHWHGTYELARNFYTEFIPELEELVEKDIHSDDAEKVAAAKALQAKIDEVLNRDNHKWFLGKMDPEEAARRKKRPRSSRPVTSRVVCPADVRVRFFGSSGSARATAWCGVPMGRRMPVTRTAPLVTPRAVEVT